MNVLDLFSGIGGFALGLERAGMRAAAFCECEPYCRAVLAHHWPGVPCYTDVRELTAARLAADGVGSVDLICGGFPCQDASVAGTGRGLAGERTGLWREMARLVAELGPAWLLAENVLGLRTRGADRVLSDLEALDYTAWPLVVGAEHVGAPHRRHRAWIVAHRNGEPLRHEQQRLTGRWPHALRDARAPLARDAGALADGDRLGCEFLGLEESARLASASGHEPDRCDGARGVGDAEGGGHAHKPGTALEHPGRAGSQERHAAGEPGSPGYAARRYPAWPAHPGSPQREWEPPRVIPRAEPGVGLDIDGLPARLAARARRAALRALGNAVVPEIPEIIGRAIMRAREEIAA